MQTIPLHLRIYRHCDSVEATVFASSEAAYAARADWAIPDCGGPSAATIVPAEAPDDDKPAGDLTIDLTQRG